MKYNYTYYYNHPTDYKLLCVHFMLFFCAFGVFDTKLLLNTCVYTNIKVAMISYVTKKNFNNTPLMGYRKSL